MNLTKEQEAVVHHPLGKHAKILAVAGSGKTTTLVYRIQHLVDEKQVNPHSIQVLMFNRLARAQFVEKMGEVGIPQPRQPKVDTFHSYSYSFVQNLIALGLLPGEREFWIEDREEQARITVHRAIKQLEQARRIPPDSVDVEEAYQAIQLWKGSLIPPERAGYRGSPYVPLVYEAYEELRMQSHALTYDDFIPIAISFLEKNPMLRKQYTDHLQHIIVDEYQDVNYGQQRLIELLAGRKADVMVVGDDDQTIYEWRGARPNYMIREFQTVFDNKPLIQYNLSHSFRFGAVIAQCAYNTILFNTNRVQKPLVAHSLEKPADIYLIEQTINQSTDTNKELANQILALVKEKGVPPSEIIILCRMFAQLSNIEAEFINRRIPYRVLGQKPFFERREVKVLCNYLQLALSYHTPITEKIKTLFLDVANTPNRMLARRDLERLMDAGLAQRLTLAQALEMFAESPDSPLSSRQRERVLELMSALERTNKRVSTTPNIPTDVVLAQLIESIEYLKHFDDFYGKGEASYDRKESLLNFIDFAKALRLPPLEFLAHIAKLDTTRGAPEEQQIVMTTVFRTKGLEYDYVIIPNCNEGYMPCLYGSDNLIYDKAGIVREPEPSESIENERRLFYVAITRARKAVYIGTGSFRPNSSSPKPSRFLDEIRYEPTRKIMSALQQYANGKLEAKRELLSYLGQYGGIKSIGQILLSHYLIRLGDRTLIGEAAKVISTCPEIPFAYRFAYSSQPEPKQNNSKPKLHSAWDEVVF